MNAVWGRLWNKVIELIFDFFLFSPIQPHVFCGLRGPPSWAWQECNQLLRLGRPWGAVTLPRWCVSGDRGGCSARRGLKPKVYLSTQTMVTAGIFPFKESSHGRAGNRTRDLIISSQRLWPLDHEAGDLRKLRCKNLTWLKRLAGKSISFIKTADLQVKFFSISRTNTGVTFQGTSGVD